MRGKNHGDLCTMLSCAHNRRFVAHGDDVSIRRLLKGDGVSMSTKNLVLILSLVSMYGHSNASQLCKVFHHESGSAQISIEQARIVLYFSESPLVNLLSDEYEKSGYKKIIFFFPKATVADKSCWKMIHGINSHKNGLYRISVDQVKQPTDGVRLAITYDPKKISFSQEGPSQVTHYGEFESIGSQKGVMLTLYNKEHLDAIKEKSTPILRTAHGKVPHIVIDCGHGGHDSGTIGCCVIPEKDVTRAVGDLLAKDLKKKGLASHLRA